MEKITRLEAAKSLYEAYVIAAKPQHQNLVELTINEEEYHNEKR